MKTWRNTEYRMAMTVQKDGKFYLLDKAITIDFINDGF